MKKACFHLKTSLFGGDKRDRTADLMNASCDRLVILGGFASNTSVLTAKSVGFCEVLSTAPIRFSRTLGSQSGSGGAAVFWQPVY